MNFNQLFENTMLTRMYGQHLLINWGEPHASETFMLSTIHKNLWIKIGELTNASIFVRST